MPLRYAYLFRQAAGRPPVRACGVQQGCSQATKICFVNQHKIKLTTSAASQLPMGGRCVGTQVPRPYVDPKLSYAYGRSNENLVYSTISRELDRQVNLAPNEVAYVSHIERKRVTFKQFNEHVNILAKALVTRFQVGRGDFVGVFAYNCYNWIVIQFACSLIGAVLSPINPSYKAHELAYVLEKGRVKCLFMPGPKSIQFELNNHLSVLKAPEVEEKIGLRQIPLEHVILMDAENNYTRDELNKFQKMNLTNQQGHSYKFYEWHATQTDGLVFKNAREVDEAGAELEGATILSPELASPDDLFAVYYTSGTTGTPKGACVSQFLAINNVRLCQVRLRNGRANNWRAVAASTLPMFHIFAGVLNTLSPIVSNTQVVYSSHKYDIAAFVESILENEANITTVTPTMLIDLLAYVEAKGLGRHFPMRIIQPGGASLAPELVAKTFKVLPELEEVRCGYGSTENGAVATFQTIHEPHSMRAFTVGPPIDFTEVRVVDTATGTRTLPLGQRGEVQTRGHNTMTGYLDEPEKTRQVITSSRWYRTGDIGFMHPHGSIEISGRLKHMIIKGGENIYPEEVEQMMHKLDCIEKVHVVGLPDERFGEQVCAWVKLKPDYVGAGGDCDTGLSEEAQQQHERDSATKQRVVSKREVIEFCKQNITYFKVPKYVLFVEDFPMTPTKKVQSHLIIERTIEMLGPKK